MASVKDTLDRFRFVIAEQTKTLNEQAAEIERLNAVIAQSSDAMTCLQAIYTDDSVKPEVRAAAANAALAYQRPKISVQAYTNVTSLAQRLDGVQAKVIEHDPAA
jgi:hypothetical protein